MRIQWECGLTDINIGNTLCDTQMVEPLPFVKINDPTVEMTFAVNDSPFAGKRANLSPAARFVTACIRNCSRMWRCRWRILPPASLSA